MKRVILIVLDSVGIGALSDAPEYSDEGANTLANLYLATGHLKVPNLSQLGLGRLVDIGDMPAEPIGCYGKMAERSASKDTTIGHWEIAGIVIDQPFPTYPDGFPPALIAEFEKRIGIITLGNHPASGTEIIKELGSEHLSTGYPIVYTSADSVFQIAAHEQIVPLETLYEYSRIARRLLTGEHAVGRVIARPFNGAVGSFERNNAARKDFSVPPPESTLLDRLKHRVRFVAGIGKIGDIFSHTGLTEEIHTREYVPLLVCGELVKNNIDLGTRDSFADCGQTIADLLDAEPLRHGHSFKKDIIDERL